MAINQMATAGGFAQGLSEAANIGANIMGKTAIEQAKPNFLEKSLMNRSKLEDLADENKIAPDSPAQLAMAGRQYAAGGKLSPQINARLQAQEGKGLSSTALGSAATGIKPYYKQVGNKIVRIAPGSEDETVAMGKGGLTDLGYPNKKSDYGLSSTTVGVMPMNRGKGAGDPIKRKIEMESEFQNQDWKKMDSLNDAPDAIKNAMPSDLQQNQQMHYKEGAGEITYGKDSQDLISYRLRFPDSSVMAGLTKFFKDKNGKRKKIFVPSAYWTKNNENFEKTLNANTLSSKEAKEIRAILSQDSLRNKFRENSSGKNLKANEDESEEDLGSGL